MIRQEDVIEFFDRLAPTWDSELVRSDEKINIILDNAGVHEGSVVLDVACGTGVLIPDYIKRNAASVTGVDISPEMIRIACGKYGIPEEPEVRQKAAGMEENQSALCKNTRISFLCGDIEQMDLNSLGQADDNGMPQGFDAVVVYNAFPHFPDPDRLIRHLASLLKEGGVLTVAHGMCREAIDAHHNGHASLVSNGLMEAERLAEIFSQYLNVETVISNDMMYQVAGRRKRSEELKTAAD